MSKVLVVDDRIASRKLLVHQLRARGFTAEGAGDGEDCLRRLEQQEPPEVVLLNISRPAAGGIEALRRLRLRWPKDRLPVIAVTAARAGSGQVVAALEAGANDCVARPVDLAVLIARLQVSLDMRQLTVEREAAGRSLEAEVLPRIFDPFEQGGRDVTRKYGGLGLGLSISRSLAEAHGGTLVARSAGRGRGTTFTLELPLAASRKEK